MAHVFFVPVSPYVFGDGGFFVVFVLLFCVCTILIPIKKQKKLKKTKTVFLELIFLMVPLGMKIYI